MRTREVKVEQSVSADYQPPRDEQYTRNPFNEEETAGIISKPPSKPKGIFADGARESVYKSAPVELGVEDVVYRAEGKITPPRAVEYAEDEEENETEPLTTELAAKTSNDLGPEWVRQELPSHSVAYAVKEVFLRTLTMPILSKIYAAHKQASLPLLTDALNNCVSMDLREATPSDMNFIMYWIRDNSYPNSPMTVSLLTRYNHQIDVKSVKSERKIREIEMTQDEYDTWKEKGLAIPTVRDMELLVDEDLHEDDRWRLEYAQYMRWPEGKTDYSDYVNVKLQLLDAFMERHGLEDGIVMVDEFSNLIAHGVVEEISFRDPLFNPEEAATWFETLARDVTASISELGIEEREANIISVLATLRRANEILKEAREIREMLARGEKPVAKEEVVALNIKATDFFPRLR